MDDRAGWDNSVWDHQDPISQSWPSKSVETRQALCESLLPLCIISHLTACWGDLQAQYVSASSWAHPSQLKGKEQRIFCTEWHQKVCFRMKVGWWSEAAGFYQPSILVWRATDQSYASCLRRTHFWTTGSLKFQLFSICGESIILIKIKVGSSGIECRPASCSLEV